MKEKIFLQLFETAEIAKFTPDQVRSYEDSLKSYRDLKNSLDTAREEGFIDGEMKGKIKNNFRVAKNLKDLGIPIDIIMKSTGLSEDEINNIM